MGVVVLSIQQYINIDPKIFLWCYIVGEQVIFISIFILLFINRSQLIKRLFLPLFLLGIFLIIIAFVNGVVPVSSDVRFFTEILPNIFIWFFVFISPIIGFQIGAFIGDISIKKNLLTKVKRFELLHPITGFEEIEQRVVDIENFDENKKRNIQKNGDGIFVYLPIKPCSIYFVASFQKNSIFHILSDVNTPENGYSIIISNDQIVSMEVFSKEL
jgi:hypothetical protein